MDTILTNAIATCVTAFVAGAAVWAKKQGEQLPDVLRYSLRILCATPLRISAVTHRLSWPCALFLFLADAVSAARAFVVIALITGLSMALVADRTNRLSMLGVAWMATASAVIVLWLIPPSGTSPARSVLAGCALLAAAVLFGGSLGSKSVWVVDGAGTTEHEQPATRRDDEHLL